MAHKSTLCFTYESKATAELVAAALRPEIGDIEGDRTRALLMVRNETVEAEIRASDIVALRAGLNTWCRLVEVAEKAVDVTKS